MVGWMLLMMALAAFGEAAAAVEQPVILAGGVSVTPAPGWSRADDVWEPGPSQVAFKRLGVVAGFAADPYSGDAEALLEEQMADLESFFSSFRKLPVASLTVAGGVPALRVLFEGVTESADLEGQIVAAVQGGMGVICLAMAPVGRLRYGQSDVNAMLAGMMMP
jgi:hypothetical protein